MVAYATPQTVQGVKVDDPHGTKSPAVLARPRCVQARVDALTLGFRVRLSDGIKALLERRAREARDHGRAAVALAAGVTLDLKRGQGRVYDLENRDVRVRIDATQDGSSEPRWTVEVIAFAVFLARTTPALAVEQLVSVAECFGEVRETRARRFDLATDWIDWTFLESDSHSWCQPARSRTVSYAEIEADAPEVVDETASELAVTTYRRLHKVTGHTIAPGGAVMCRIYDKAEELLVNASTERGREKAAVELEIWSRNGVPVPAKGEPLPRIVRVEFQLRGDALSEIVEFNARDPRVVVENLDALWRYCVTRWCRLIVRDNDRRARCSIDVRWEAVQAVRFGALRFAATRRRLRGGVSAEQFIGCGVSVAAHAGRLDGLGVRVSSLDGASENRRAAIRRMSESDVRECLRSRLVDVAHAAIVVAGGEYIDHRRDPWDALEHFEIRCDAAIARAQTLPERIKSTDDTRTHATSARAATLPPYGEATR